MNDGGAGTRRMTYLFMLTYFVSYVTRVNYGAVISEMVLYTGFGKTELSIALTGSFITYGVGQIVSGVIADRFSPKRLVAAGIGVSALMNLLIPLCPNIALMTVVWCVNGFAQAMFWPPMVRLMTENYDTETYKKRSVTVAYGSSLGTAAVYLLSPLLILWGGYRVVFFVSAGIGALMLPVWLRFAPEGRKGGAEPGQKEKKRGIALFITPLMIALMTAIALQGMLRDGATTWMPSLVSESFGIDNRFAILSGVILPLFALISLRVTSVLYRKKLKNPLLCTAVIFSFGAAAALGLIFANGRNAVLTVLLTALLIASMHGVNLIVTGMIPPFFAGSGRVSTVSGVLNACVYVGSAVSTYAIARIVDVWSWTVTLIVWFAVASAGTAICFVCVRPWRNAHPKESEK